jgi:hypothetical protein
MNQRRSRPFSGTIALVSKARKRTSKGPSLAQKASDEDTALDTALREVDRFADSLGRRWERARERHDRAKEDSPAVEQAWASYQEAWADLEGAWRLRDAVQAAVSRARAQVAVAEAEAALAIAKAFCQFATARESRRGRAVAAPASSQPKKRAAPLKSPEELGALAAKAKEAVVYVIVDRNRLVEAVGEVREQLTEMRRSLGAAGVNGAEVGWVQERITALEATEAYLVREHAIASTIVDQLLLGLRAIFENLPAAGPKAATRRASRRVRGRKA